MNKSKCQPLLMSRLLTGVADIVWQATSLSRIFEGWLRPMNEEPQVTPPRVCGPGMVPSGPRTMGSWETSINTNPYGHFMPLPETKNLRFRSGVAGVGKIVWFVKLFIFLSGELIVLAAPQSSGTSMS
jgi:hypothetical protein